MNLLKLSSLVTLSATTLLSGTTVLLNQNVNAPLGGQVLEATTPADVQFSEGKGDTEVDIPEKVPPVIINPIPGEDGDGNPIINTGPLTIAHAPTFDFGSQEISTSDQRYPLIAERFEMSDKNGNGTDVWRPYVSFVQVQDTRGTSEGWHLTVELSQFTAGENYTGQNETIRGAHIELTNSYLRYVPAIRDQTPRMIINDEIFILRPGGAVTLMNAEDGKGAGTTDIIWGHQETLDQGFDMNAVGKDKNMGTLNHDVKLFVPGEYAIDATVYTATLDWTLEQSPMNIIEE